MISDGNGARFPCKSEADSPLYALRYRNFRGPRLVL
jgi:hypothetical protein